MNTNEWKFVFIKCTGLLSRLYDCLFRKKSCIICYFVTLQKKWKPFNRLCVEFQHNSRSFVDYVGMFNYGRKQSVRLKLEFPLIFFEIFPYQI